MNIQQILIRPELKRYSRYYTVLEPYFASPKTRSSISLILTLSSLIIFGIFAIRPTVTTIFELTKELATLQRVNTKLGGKIAALAKAQEILESEKRSLSILEEAAPLKPDVAHVVKEVEGATAISNVSIASMQFQRVDYSQIQLNSPGEITAVQIPVTLSIRGAQAPIASFLSALYNSRRFFTTGNLEIMGNRFKDTETGQTLQISLSAPYFTIQPKTDKAKPIPKKEPTEQILQPTTKREGALRE